MTDARRYKTYSIVILSGIAVILTDAHLLARKRNELTSIKRQIELSQADFEAARFENEKRERELASAEQELSALQAEIAAQNGSRNPEREAQIKAWLGRSKRIKQLFIQRPDQKIPELQLLSGEDW